MPGNWASNRAEDAADDQAFQEGVERGGDGRPGLLEDRDQGHDEAADGSHHHPGSYYLGVLGLVVHAPNPGGRHQDAQQQQDRLIGGSLDGHGLVGPGDMPDRSKGIVTREPGCRSS